MNSVTCKYLMTLQASGPADQVTLILHIMSIITLTSPTNKSVYKTHGVYICVNINNPRFNNIIMILVRGIKKMSSVFSMNIFFVRCTKQMKITDFLPHRSFKSFKFILLFKQLYSWSDTHNTCNS